MNPRRSITAGRRWAYGGAALGISLSVAANVEHVLVQSRHTAPGAVVSAAAAPVILLVALEVIARTTWPAGIRWVLLRWLALPTVAVVAASISYLHMRSLLLAYGESTWAATVGPLAVDGLMAVALGALLVPLDEVTPDEGRPEGRVGEPPVAGLQQPAGPAVRRARTTKARDVTVAAPGRGGADDARSGVLRSLDGGPARQAELVRATGLPRRTVRDHLINLVQAGLITQNGQQYRLTESGRRTTSRATPSVAAAVSHAADPVEADDSDLLVAEARELDGAGAR